MGHLAALLMHQQFRKMYRSKEELGMADTITLRNVIDMGEEIQKAFSDFSNEAKRSQLVKPSMDIGLQIQRYVAALKEESQYYRF